MAAILTTGPGTEDVEELDDSPDDGSSDSFPPDEDDEILAVAAGTDPTASMVGEETDSSSSAPSSDEDEATLASGRNGTFSAHALHVLLVLHAMVFLSLMFSYWDADSVSRHWPDRWAT